MRNQRLSQLRIAYRNDNEHGYVVEDDLETISKKRALAASLWQEMSEEYQFSYR